MTLHFVYIKVNGKAFPQKWNGDDVDGHGQKRKGGLLFFKTLDEHEEKLNLNELCKLYPYEDKKNEVE